MADNSLPRHHQSHRTTEQLIVQSFIDLLNETPNHPLKVIDICRKAYINRGTFYHYFESVEELVQSCEDHLVNKLFLFGQKIFKHQTLASFTKQLSTTHLNLFKQFVDELPLIDVLLHKSTRSHLTDKLIEVIENSGAAGLAMLAPHSNKQLRTLIAVDSAAEIIGLLSYWSMHPDIEPSVLANLLALSEKGQFALLQNKN